MFRRLFNSRAWKKTAASALLGFFVFSFVVSGVLVPVQAARAQYTDPFQAGLQLSWKVLEEVKDMVVQVGTVVIMNTASYFANQIAYSLAVSLTSDCPGQKPCWDSKGFQQGVIEASQGAVGEFIGQLSDQSGLTALGFNLCKPPDPRFVLKIQLGILKIAEAKPRPPKCDLNQIVQNYRNVVDSLSSQDLLKRVSVQFEPGQGAISAALGIQGSIGIQASDASAAAVIKKLTCAAAGGGFCDVVDKVTQRVITPAVAVEDAFLRLQRESKDMPKLNAMITTAGSLAKGAVASVIVPAVQTFAQTLTARLLDKLFKSGLLNAADLLATQPDLIFSAEGLLQPAGTEGARVAQSDFLTAKPKESNVYDPLLLFSTCPPRNRTSMNCVVDDKLANAIRVADVTPITVGEALKTGILHGDWVLIPKAAQLRDQDPSCYVKAYCESNLKKLRAVRILSIGWEIAASKSNFQTPVTLNEVVSQFNDCNPEGQADIDHPWCHLIDPDWVLRMPLMRCNAQVYGTQLVTPEIPTRLDSCVDAPSCIKQDDSGTCTGGYGYCLREKNIWRFGGESCPAQYNTCRSLRSRLAPDKPVNYLLNTIDYGVCTAENAGCLAYATNLNVTSQGLTGIPTDLSDDWLTTPARYFNQQVEKCGVENVGCTSLVKLAQGQSLNLVRNGGFEELEDGDGDGTPDHPKYWIPSGQVPEGKFGFVSTDGTKSLSGNNALSLSGASPQNLTCTLPGNPICATDTGCTCTDPDGFSCKIPASSDRCRLSHLVGQGGIGIFPNRTYTISANFKAVNGATSLQAVGLNLAFESATDVPVNINTFGNTTSIAENSGGCTALGNQLQLAVTSTSFVEQAFVSCTFNTTAPVKIVSVYARNTNSGVYVDNIQLEEGGGTPFHEVYGSETELVNIKVPPSYLGCIGEASDRPECASFAGVCRENEIGCERYTPVNGDPSVPGIVGPQDSCPASCSGYDVFKQEASEFDEEKFPVYFIPSSALQCSEGDVGCSEFTNIDNEQVSYFTKFRLCQKPTPGDDTGTFYTWEGSEATGYELKIWRLKTSNATASHDPNGSDIAVLGSTVTGKAPCTQINGSGVCLDPDPTSTANPAAGSCTKAILDGGNFDCREFYDTLGNRHFRLLSKTIIATEECASYRATVSTNADCTNTTGRWDPAKNECIYTAAASESNQCIKVVNGCRAYKGNAATNVRTLFTETFEGDAGEFTGGTVSAESVTVGGHSLKIAQNGTAAKPVISSDISIIARDRSYSLNFWARGAGQLAVKFDTLTSDNSFSVKDDDPNTAAIENNPLTPTVTLSSTWRQYSLGPVIVTDANWPSTVLTVSLSFGGASSEVFIDNVVLKEVQDNIFVIRDSWATPFECDATSEGQPSPLEMLGCRAYRDSSNTTVYLRSFSQLCRERAIGCAAYSDTKNNANPYAETFNAVCTLRDASLNPRTCTTPGGCSCSYTPANGNPFVKLSDVCRVQIGEQTCRFHLDEADNTTVSGGAPDRAIIPTDERIYLAAQPENFCSADVIGCKNLGIQHLAYQGICLLGHTNVGSTEETCTDDKTDATCLVKPGENNCSFSFDDGFVDKWSATILRDNPEKYAQTLCLAEAQYCEEFQSFSGNVYFKDPVDKVCEFKENVSVDVVDPENPSQTIRETRSGWFQKSSMGNNFPCYSELLKNGREYQMYKNSDQQCTLTANTTGVDSSGKCTNDSGCLCQLLGRTVCLVEKNGSTCGYQGWVGMCQPEFDRCEEFVDPLDTSDAYEHGQPYYYIDNDKLDRSSCNGQGSLKAGCVLFKQTSNTANVYSAAATYFKSLKSANNAAVSTERCGEVGSTGSRDERYCGMRCKGFLNGQCKNSTTNVALNPPKDCVGDSECGTGEYCSGTAYFGTGCDNETPGACANGEVCVPEPDTNDRKITVDDTNVVLKVRRDRECGQWLTCAFGYGAYDSQKNRWQTVCTQLGVCDRYFQSGDAVECSHFVPEVPKILTKEEYVNRDVTWRGLEYAGFSLFNKFQPQFLTPVNINPGKCRDSATGEVIAGDVDCWNSSDCGAGSYCSAPQAGNCVSSDSQVDGEACSDDSECVGADHNNPGSCIKSKSAFRFGIEIGPKCEVNNAPCPQPDGKGMCYQHKCMYDLAAGEGGVPRALGIEDGENEQACRAYPESDSPFSSAVLDTNASDGGYDSPEAGAGPLARKAGFQGANVCVKGDDCDCSYQKLTYGQGGAVRYYAYSGGVDKSYGICSGGESDGKACRKDNNDCNEISTSDPGKCQKQTKRSSALGWPGLCIDTDFSMNINGDANQFACNLWLPVDQLAGTPDLFNQHIEAGFIPPDQPLLYCQVSRGNAAVNNPQNYEREIYSETEGIPTQACESTQYCRQFNDRDSCTSSKNNYDVGFSEVRGDSCAWRLDEDGNGTCVDSVTAGGLPPFAGNGSNACADYGSIAAPISGTLAILLFPQWACPWVPIGQPLDDDFRTCRYSPPRLFSKGLGLPGFPETVSWSEYPADYTAAPNHFFNEPIPNIRLFESDIVALDVQTTGGRFMLFRDERVQPTGEHTWTFAHDWAGSGAGFSADSKPLVTDNSSKCLQMIDKDMGRNCGSGPAGFPCLEEAERDRETKCGEIAGVDKNNCIAARAVFGKHPQNAPWARGQNILLDIEAVTCHNERPALPWAVRTQSIKALLRESCDEIALMAGGDPTDTEEKAMAWTDRLWLASTWPQPTGYSRVYPPASSLTPIRLMTPFGRVFLNDFDEDEGVIDYDILGDEEPPSGSPQKRAYAFDQSNGQVRDSNNASMGPYALPILDADGGSPFTVATANIDPATQSDFPIVTSAATSFGGLPFACSGPCKGPTPAPSPRIDNKDTQHNSEADYDFGKNALSNLFARAIGVYKFDDSNDVGYGNKANLYKYQSNKNWDVRPSLGINGTQPRVLMLSGFCNEKDKCEESGEGLTVEANGGNISPMGSPVDVTVESGEKIFLKFFMFANKDHMPITRLTVDLGDGSTPFPRQGLFRNQRGLYKEGDVYKDWCGRPDVAEFGLQLQACDSQYVRQELHYICNPEDSSLQVCDNNNPPPCKTFDGKCVFVPKVQILDNWDICNGTCTGDTAWKNGKTLCMNNDPVEDTGNNECGIGTTLPPYDAESDDIPWTAFNGRIIVSPP